MVDVSALIEDAGKNFGASLLDDPTLWVDGETPRLHSVEQVCREAVRANAVSSVASALGRAADALAQAVEAEYRECGAWAEYDTVVSQLVSGLTVDTSGFVLGGSWDDLVASVRAALAGAVGSMHVPEPDPEDVKAYIRSDPRLSGLALSTGYAEKVSEAPTEERFEPKTPGETKRAPFLPGLLSAAGLMDTDIASIMGISRAYWSMIKRGKRPWPGVSQGQASRLKAELEGRTVAVAAAIEALDRADIGDPEAR